METLLPIIVQAVTGIIGGQAIGAALSQAAMGQLTKLLSGAVGGIAGGTLLGAALGGAAGDPMAGGGLGGLLGDAIGGAGGGAILTGIVGAVMKAAKR